MAKAPVMPGRGLPGLLQAILMNCGAADKSRTDFCSTSKNALSGPDRALIGTKKRNGNDQNTDTDAEVSPPRIEDFDSVITVRAQAKISQFQPLCEIFQIIAFRLQDSHTGWRG
ncbi:hypothetical protein [Asticcacaulis sp.]|uniref:hypothetical protein n=1 Tax=Asticcacaulis sp. TaxID=1872648 RepID=UPI00260B2CB7|nr:hypothetical protein [Asticcacaulis sp.]